MGTQLALHSPGAALKNVEKLSCSVLRFRGHWCMLGSPEDITFLWLWPIFFSGCFLCMKPNAVKTYKIVSGEIIPTWMILLIFLCFHFPPNEWAGLGTIQLDFFLRSLTCSRFLEVELFNYVLMQKMMSSINSNLALNLNTVKRKERGRTLFVQKQGVSIGNSHESD